MDLPADYQGNFSLTGAPLPFLCCKAGNSLVPRIPPSLFSGTSDPSASCENMHNMKQSYKYVFPQFFFLHCSILLRPMSWQKGVCLHRIVKEVLCPHHQLRRLMASWPASGKACPHVCGTGETAAWVLCSDLGPALQRGRGVSQVCVEKSSEAGEGTRKQEPQGVA